MARSIKISLDDGTVFCTPDQGNVWAKTKDEEVEWTRGNRVMNFRLRFHKEAIQGNGATSDWPFAIPAPEPPNSTDIVTGFKAPVKEESGVYEYTIEVNVDSTSADAPTAYLDPMIIVGRG
jgi:hypothetical protein